MGSLLGVVVFAMNKLLPLSVIGQIPFMMMAFLPFLCVSGYAGVVVFCVSCASYRGKQKLVLAQRLGAVGRQRLERIGKL